VASGTSTAIRMAGERFGSLRLLGRECPRRNAAPFARVEEAAAVSNLLIGAGDKQPAIFLERGGHDLPEDRVLLDAFARRVRVGHRVAGSTVQQAVVATRAAAGQLTALDQRYPQPAQGQVMSQGPPVTPPPMIRAWKAVTAAVWSSKVAAQVVLPAAQVNAFGPGLSSYLGPTAGYLACHSRAR
jgi:hypothetical protein